MSKGVDEIVSHGDGLDVRHRQRVASSRRTGFFFACSTRSCEQRCGNRS
jgi:hypothetical protein